MVTAQDKLVNAAKASAIDNEVAGILADLQNNNDCIIRGELPHVQITNAVEVFVPGDNSRKCVVIFFPPRAYNDFVRRNLSKFTHELEKKLRRPTMLVAKRTPVPKERPDMIGLKRRPYSRSQTAVNEALLTDIVAPAEIVGKRLRVSTDGSRLLRVMLDHRCRETMEDKLDVFSAAYKRLAKTDAVFSFGEPL